MDSSEDLVGRPMAPATEGKADVGASSSPVELRSLSATVDSDVADCLRGILHCWDRGGYRPGMGGCAIWLLPVDFPRFTKTEAVRLMQVAAHEQGFTKPGAMVTECSDSSEANARKMVRRAIDLANATPQSSTSPAPTMGEV